MQTATAEPLETNQGLVWKISLETGEIVQAPATLSINELTDYLRAETGAYHQVKLA